MPKRITSIIVSALMVVSGVMVLWFRYRISPIPFYSLVVVCIGCSILNFIKLMRNKEMKRLPKGFSMVLLSGIVIGMALVLKAQALNFMIQSKTDAYFDKLPIKVFGKAKMSPQDIEFLQQNRPMSDEDLSQAGNAVIYEDKPLNPEHGAISYTVLFKGPYYVDSLDLSTRTCVDGVFCTSHYTGSVILDAKTKELLHFSIRNAGGGK